MKVHWKVSMTVIMTGLLAMVLLICASIGNAAAPDPQLTDDLVFVGNGKGAASVGNDVKVVDVDAMAVINTIGGNGMLASNHGMLLNGTDLWTANAALTTYGNARAVKIDLTNMSQAAYDVYPNAGGPYASGFCGIERAPNGSIWATNMTGTSNVGGIYDVQSGAYVNTAAGADNAATCGINWSTDGSTAYASLMSAKKYNQMTWPGATITGSTGAITGTGLLHISDVAKTAQYAYVTGGNVAGQGKFIVVDLTSMTVVNTIDATNPADLHGPTIAHNEGFLYIHARTPGGSDTSGQLLIYDIGGGTAGGTKVTPVLIGVVNDQGTPGVSCGTDIGSKSQLCPPTDVSMDIGTIAWSDFTGRILSVNYNVYNHNALAALGAAISNSTATNGVTVTSIGAGGNVPGNGSIVINVKYHVPAGVKTFSTTTGYGATNLCNQSGGGTYVTDVPVPRR